MLLRCVQKIFTEWTKKSKKGKWKTDFICEWIHKVTEIVKRKFTVKINKQKRTKFFLKENKTKIRTFYTRRKVFIPVTRRLTGCFLNPVKVISLGTIKHCTCIYSILSVRILFRGIRNYRTVTFTEFIAS